MCLLHELREASPAVLAPARHRAQRPNGFAQDAPVNMLHVELQQHLYSETFKTTVSPDTISVIPFSDMLKLGLDAPYLMNMLLCVGALHLSVVKPEKRDSYRHHAANLQT